MPRAFDLKLDLPADDTFKERARYSSPINFDISALDARDTGLSTVACLTPLPVSPNSPGNERDRQRSFFANYRASRSASRLQDTATLSPTLSPMEGSRDGRSSGKAKSTLYPYRKAPGSTPELSLVAGKGVEGVTQSLADLGISKKVDLEPKQQAVVTPPALPDRDDYDMSPASTTQPGKANKKRLPQVLSRSRSIRSENEKLSASKKTKASTPRKTHAPQKSSLATVADTSLSRSAPDRDRTFRDVMKSSMRNRSADHAAAVDSDEEKPSKTKPKKDKEKEREREREAHPLNATLRKNNASQLFSHISNTGSRAADGLGKAGRGIFGKLVRSGSSNDGRPALIADEDYVPRVLKQPLVEQTRITRIAKSYDHCKDKTEFWMPALPWRCIDYLNGKCEEEGLYRVSGGVTSIKQWRKRFDTELDVNLLNERDLYDASTIASLFKEWIRELPEEIFPKDRQARVTRAVPLEPPLNSSSLVTQALRDELSNLPPFNYYLLFAITCHLSLLLSHQEINKMSLDNLFRCFNQSLKLDGRIFYPLVGEWRLCWQGCWPENDYLRAEYEFLNKPYPILAEERSAGPSFYPDERAISSSGSSMPSATGRSTPETQRPPTTNNHSSHFAGESEGNFPNVNGSAKDTVDQSGASLLKPTSSTGRH